MGRNQKWSRANGAANGPMPGAAITADHELLNV